MIRFDVGIFVSAEDWEHRGQSIRKGDTTKFVIHDTLNDDEEVATFYINHMNTDTLKQYNNWNRKLTVTDIQTTGYGAFAACYYMNLKAGYENPENVLRVVSRIGIIK